MRDKTWRRSLTFIVSFQTPGPGSYKVGDTNCWKKKQPSYSISGRNMIPGDSTQKPGPGSYSPERVTKFFLILLRKLNAEI